MASIFDILSTTDFSSALDMLGSKAKGAFNDARENAPGGLPGLFGAGALGAVLGNMMSGNAVKGVALAGLGAVAYNFYKKWAMDQEAQAQEASGPAYAPRPELPGQTARAKNQFGPGFGSAGTGIDPTVQLIARAMNYAARADGNIDAVEQQRMREVLKSVLPGQNVETVIESVSSEPIDPAKIAEKAVTAEQAEDLYRLSCMTIDADQFMEKSYLDALAQAMGISPRRKGELENEAAMAKKQLRSAISS